MSFRFDFTTLCLLGASSLFLGLALAMTRNRSAVVRGPAATLAVASAMASFGYFVVPCASFMAVGLIMGPAIGLVSIIHSKWAWKMILLWHHRVQNSVALAGLFIVTGFGMLIASGTRADEEMSEDSLSVSDEFDRELLAYAVTDRGRPIPLLVPRGEGRATRTIDHEKRMDHFQNGQLLRLSAPTSETNCHGWIFTDGRYLIPAESVEMILTDNGYEAAKTPKVGDIVVYRDGLRDIIHTAIVRAIWDDRVVVESKWGRLGTYAHLVDGSNYGIEYTYYRTSRPTALLKGLPNPSSIDLAKLSGAK